MVWLFNKIQQFFQELRNRIKSFFVKTPVLNTVEQKGIPLFVEEISAVNKKFAALSKSIVKDTTFIINLRHAF